MRFIFALGGLVAVVLATVFASLADPGSHPPQQPQSLGLQPLPEGKVNWLFEKIQKRERVEPRMLHAALIGPQMALRADAARMLAQWGDASSVPHLIHALTDESSHVGARYPDAGMATTRYWAARSLREMTGRNFGFSWDDPLDRRNAAVLRWTTWYQTILADRDHPH